MAKSFFIDLLLTANPQAEQQALRLYQKAIHRAQRRLKAQGRPLVIGADEVATELEWLLYDLCKQFNCLNQAKYQKLHHAILTWTPISTDPHVLQRCGLLQNGLLALLPQLQQKQRLECLCEQYQAHLAQDELTILKKQSHTEEQILQQSASQRLSIQTAKTTLDSSFCSLHDSPTKTKIKIKTKWEQTIDEDLSRIHEKQAAISRMRQVWKSPEVLSTQYQHFQTAFQQERRILEKHRDSATVILLKKVATVLSFGIAAICGIWSVKGQKTTQKIEQVFKTSSPSA